MLKRLPGIYIASKTKHAERWRKLRASGMPIISTWIDEAGPGETKDFSDLWYRCVSEAAGAEILIAYREEGEVLKGALVEIGASLASGGTVFLVGFGADNFSFKHHPAAVLCVDLDHALISAAIAHSRKVVHG